MVGTARKGAFAHPTKAARWETIDPSSARRIDRGELAPEKSFDWMMN